MIVIDGKGLNGEKADAIELYTRAAKILGQIKAEPFNWTVLISGHVHGENK